MAQISTRKRGNTWEYSFEIASVNGKRKRKSKGGFRTKKECLEAGTKAKAEYDSTVFKPEQIIESMLKKYGKDSQIDVCIEEMSELIKALVKERRTRLYNRENAFAEASKNDIKEELADVLFMCQYLCQIFGFTPEELSDIINKKALRTQQRYLGGDK